MKKIHINLLVIAFMIIMFFMSANTYAAENLSQEVYKNTQETINGVQGVDKDDRNAGSSTSLGWTSTVINGVVMLSPESMNPEISQSTDLPDSAKKGIYGMVESGVTNLYQTQPLVNVYAHLAEEWVPGYQDTSVYAADSGYKELQDTGIDKIWAVSRNISYVFFIVIMIIVGFMIMFRSKLGGQTLVTLGNTLPNIIVALIGVTFSFAIAGLIIDIGGLIMSLLADIVREVGEFDNIVTLESFGAIFNALTPQALVQKIEDLIGINIAPNGNIFGLFAVGIPLTALYSVIPIFGGASFGTMLVLLTVLIVGTVGVFFVFITLIKAYLGIIINVITGPFQIAASAIPNNGKAFINWIKSLLRNVLVYPITFAILNLPGLIYSLSGGNFNLPGPDKLTLGSQGQIANFFESNVISWVTIFIFQILFLFIASKADKFAAAIIPPTASREAQAAGAAAGEGISKIPIIGKLLTAK